VAINTVTDLRNTDAGQTAFTVRQNPVGGSTECHAVQVTQAATSGGGAGVNVVSNNSSAPAIRARAAGPLLSLYNASNILKFEIDNTGAITTAASTTFTSLTTTGAVSVGTTLAVTGASTLTGDVSVGGTLTVTGTTTLNSGLSGTTATFSSTLNATGNTTLGGTLGVTGAATLSSTLAVTGNATIGGTFGVTGYTTLAGGQANGDWAIFGNLSAFGSGKAYRFRTNGSSLDLEATGVDLILSNWSGTNFDGTQRSYLRFAANALASQWAGKVEFVDALYGTANHTLDGTANQIGFYGTAPAAKQTVTGSRGGNAALASLITALATYGLVTDGSSA
jgi:hypothetical protein